MTGRRERKPLADMDAAEAICADINRVMADHREHMRTHPHMYEPADGLDGLCLHCAAGEVYWIHASEVVA